MSDAKPRILFLVTSADWGGVQHFILEIAKEARKNDIEVMIAAGESGELKQAAEREGIAYHQLESVKREISPLYDFAAIYEIRKLIQSFQPTVVHLNSSKMGVLGSIAADLERVPRTIYRIGGWSFLEDIHPLKQWVYRMAEKWTASKKDVVVTVHPGDEAVARSLGIMPRHKLLTIPNGIDLATFDAQLQTREAARNALGIGLNETVVGTIANFYGPKDLLGYLDAIALITTEHTRRSAPISLNPRFVIIGDGPEHDKIFKRREELGLQERVILAGRQEQAASFLSAFDIFVLPSSKEGMPWVLLEAMAARLPCIATDVGACRWMLGKAGIIVPSKNAQRLAEAVQLLLHDSQARQNLGTSARQEVEKRFRWEITSKQTLALFYENSRNHYSRP